MRPHLSRPQARKANTCSSGGKLCLVHRRLFPPDMPLWSESLSLSAGGVQQARGCSLCCGSAEGFREMAFTFVMYAPSGWPNKSMSANYSKMKFSRGRKGREGGGGECRTEISPASPLSCSLCINGEFLITWPLCLCTKAEVFNIYRATTLERSAYHIKR